MGPSGACGLGVSAAVVVADHGGDQREERGGEGRPVLEGRPDHQPPHRADGDDADEGAGQHVSDRALDVLPLARERWLPADVAGRVRLRRRETRTMEIGRASCRERV